MVYSAPALDDCAWQTIAPRFSEFMTRLRPDLTERSYWQTSLGEIHQLFERRYWRRSAPPAEAVTVIGGIGKDTALAGCRSVDALLVMPQSAVSWNAAKNNVNHAPISTDPAFRELMALFSARFGSVTATRDGGLEIRQRRKIEGDSATIRLIPAYARSDGGFLTRRPMGDTHRLEWQARNPEAEAEYVDESDRVSAGNARDLIRMLKAWRRALAVPISPFALELLACRFASTWLYRRRSVLFYDWMLRDLFFWLTAHSSVSVAAPGVNELINVGSHWLPYAQDAYDHAAAAAQFERDNQIKAATTHWRAIFGCTFPAESEVATTPSIGLPSHEPIVRRPRHLN
jgi:hypothetical protein